jgi:hypothetical protein
MWRGLDFCMLLEVWVVHDPSPNGRIPEVSGKLTDYIHSLLLAVTAGFVPAAFRKDVSTTGGSKGCLDTTVPLKPLRLYLGLGRPDAPNKHSEFYPAISGARQPTSLKWCL